MRLFLLAAYDVTDPGRLKGARLAVTDWAHGGQKSVWECFAVRQHRRDMLSQLIEPLDPRCDRLALLMPEMAKARQIGRGVFAHDAPLILVG